MRCNRITVPDHRKVKHFRHSDAAQSPGWPLASATSVLGAASPSSLLSNHPDA
jgi:hypothetical protein